MEPTKRSRRKGKASVQYDPTQKEEKLVRILDKAFEEMELDRMDDQAEFEKQMRQVYEQVDHEDEKVMSLLVKSQMFLDCGEPEKAAEALDECKALHPGHSHSVSIKLAPLGNGRALWVAALSLRKPIFLLQPVTDLYVRFKCLAVGFFRRGRFLAAVAHNVNGIGVASVSLSPIGTIVHFTQHVFRHRDHLLFA